MSDKKFTISLVATAIAYFCLGLNVGRAILAVCVKKENQNVEVK